MKKHLLTVLGLSIAFAGVAQTAKLKPSRAVKQNTRVKATLNEGGGSAPYNFQAPSIVKSHRTAGVYGREYLGTYAPKGFGSSANAFGLLTINQTVINANQELNAVLFTNRQSVVWKPTGFNSGWIYSKWSTNMGTSWDSLYVEYENANVNRGRYPGGVILNQPGNSTLANATAVTAGPMTNGAGWVGNFFSSINLVSTTVAANDPTYSTVTGSDTNMAVNPDPGFGSQAFARNYFSASGNVGHVAGMIYSDPLTPDGWRGAMINKASLATNGAVSWTIDSIKPGFHKASDGTWDGYETPVMAWSKDGNTGYVIFYGVDSNSTIGTSQRSFQPITYKTTDGGTTWNRYCPLFDWNSTILVREDTMLNDIGGNATNYKAWFTQSEGVDATVDYNGDLHLITQIGSASSDNEDSLGYAYSSSFIYDVHTIKEFGTGANSYCVTLLDTIWSTRASGTSGEDGYTENPWGDGSGAKLDQDARLQIARSDDGKVVFFVWADTDTTLANGYNTAPDIYIKGFDVSKSKFTKTYNVTQETSEGYWVYASDIALKNGASYAVPLTYSNSANKNGGSNIYHSFIDNAVIDTVMFDQNGPNDSQNFNCAYTSVKEVVKSFSNVSLSPNPTSGVSELSVSLDKASEIVVSVYNVTGALVMSKTIKGTEGNNTITLNANNWNNGVYFYNVKSGSAAASGKLVVQK